MLQLICFLWLLFLSASMVPHKNCIYTSNIHGGFDSFSCFISGSQRLVTYLFNAVEPLSLDLWKCCFSGMMKTELIM